MSYALCIPHRDGRSGLTLFCALSNADGSPHATVRDIAVVEVAQGFYRINLATIPDGYMGAGYVYTTALGAAAVWTGSVLLGHFPLNPQETENADVKTSTVFAQAGTGAYAVTLTVTDGTDPVPGARVRLSQGISTFVATTDVNGEALFALDAGSYGVAVTKEGYQFTPETRTVTGEEAGTITDALEMAATVIPSAPADLTLCRVYGRMETLDNRPAAGLTIKFTLALVVTPGAARSERLLDQQPILATTNAEGELTNANGDLWLDLQRNDLVLPDGTTYLVYCKELGLHAKAITLEEDTFDLASILP